MTIPTKVPCPCGYKGINGTGCSKFLVPPLINRVEGSVTGEEADEIIEAYRNSARLLWLLDNPSRIGVLQFKMRPKRIEWIDQQMTKPRPRRA